MAPTATYAIGDVHGCRESLQALMDRLPWRPERDRLWLVGDLVNRGPDSLEVLRWARRMGRELGDRFACVLGNHEVHLLARAAGVAPPGARDTLDALFAAPDRDDLLAWVARRPLLHRDGGRLLVHAGLLPGWDADEAEELARVAEVQLRGPESRTLLAHHAARTGRFPGSGFGPRGHRPPPSIAGVEAGVRCDRAERALAAFTLLRVVDASGRPRYGFAGPPEGAPPGTVPWFEAPRARWRHRRNGRTADLEVVFGHWAALGLRTGPGFRALDSGCVWGGRLTALRLEDGAVFQVGCRDGGHQATECRA